MRLTILAVFLAVGCASVDDRGGLTGATPPADEPDAGTPVVAPPATASPDAAPVTASPDAAPAAPPDAQPAVTPDAAPALDAAAPAPDGSPAADLPPAAPDLLAPWRWRAVATARARDPCRRRRPCRVVRRDPVVGTRSDHPHRLREPLARSPLHRPTARCRRGRSPAGSSACTERNPGTQARSARGPDPDRTQRGRRRPMRPFRASAAAGRTTASPAWTCLIRWRRRRP